jgi:hypothetical protein
MSRYSAHLLHRCIVSAAPRCRRALCAAMAAALIGCQSGPPQVTAPPRATAPERTPGATVGASAPGAAAQLGDGFYDWHGLLIAPFGTVLKAIPLALHEVLLFRDEAHFTGAAEDAAAGVPGGGPPECYAADAPAPPFAGRTPDEYVLCFKRDRLARIQASVRVTMAEAPEVFAAACAAWLKNAAPAAAGAATPAAEPPTAEPSAAACEGIDGEIRFNGRLGEVTDRPEMPPTESTMSITLESASVP